jgi:PAS domain S-box-containing protein
VSPAPPSPTRRIRVLLVEDNPGDARLIVEMLREASDEFDLQQVDSLRSALAELDRAAVDVVLLDLGLPDSQGLETFERVRRGGGAVDKPIIVISGLDDETVALEAVRAGAQDYLLKGQVEGRGLARVMRHAIERQRGEARLRAIVRAALDAHVTMDATGTITGWNPQAETVFGWPAAEVLGRPLAEIVIPPARREAHWNGLRHFLTTGAGPILNQRIELTAIRKDGREFPVELAITPIRVGGDDWSFSAFVRDITERKLLQQQLIQSQKMEAVGRLAGGVAHDFNNLLTAIFGYADLLAEELAPDHPGRADLNEIRTATTRAAALTRQLLAFSRQQVLQPVVLNLNDMVENIEKMLRRILGEDVELHTALAPNLANTRADPGQIEQVIMNLAVNARDAMPTGGKLTIETANVELDAAYAKQHQPVIPGHFVMLAVSDTGIGMDDATKARIFEPFFTTKEVGKGTGLGLATVYGIVKQSGGYVWLYSEPGKGAAFKIYLPRVDAERDAPVAAPESVGTVAGTETVLVAEDDPLLLPLARDLLKKLGYHVLEARDSAEALAVARRHHGDIHLLVSDVVMPRGGGFQLAQQLIAERPALRVLYVSGYTDEAIVRHGLLARGLNYLQKPFTPAVLARKVREVLDAK